jgi:hypothetical protein
MNFIRRFAKKLLVVVGGNLVTNSSRQPDPGCLLKKASANLLHKIVEPL